MMDMFGIAFYFITVEALDIYYGKVEVSVMEKELVLENNQMKEKTDHRFWRNFNEYR